MVRNTLDYGRSGGHWSFCQEERTRDDWAEAPGDTAIASLRRTDRNWQQLEALESLEEITAIAPNPQQLAVILRCRNLKRLRLWDIRRAELDGLAGLKRLEELALFNVSGPDALPWLAEMPALRSLLLENMPSLPALDDLGLAANLRCLFVRGGDERPQRAPSLAFLGRLGNLEHLGLSAVSYRGGSPAFAGLTRAKKLRRLVASGYLVPLEDFAWLARHCPWVEACHPPLWWISGREFGGVAEPPGEPASGDPLAEVALARDGEWRTVTKVAVALLGKGERCLTTTIDCARKRIAGHEARWQAALDAA